jgi:uncharacterized protein YkwD
MNRKLLLLPLLFICLTSMRQTDTKKKISVTLSAQERELYAQLCVYRESLQLPKIPLSTSLTYVAQQHCNDLQTNVGKLTHSWSTCDYKKDASCMWLKPEELTNYKGYGYECSHWSSGIATAESALSGWKNSPLHNDVLINQGMWKHFNWQAVGIGISGNYACIWFGEKADPAGSPE